MAEDEVGAVAAHYAAWAARLRDVAEQGLILDLASGRGRHARAMASGGLGVVAVDRNRESLGELARAATRDGTPIACVRADLENRFEPPFRPESFGAILVFRYLHRPLMPWIEGALRPGGLLLYETFTTQQRSLGWGPRRAEFLLEPGELPRLFPELEIDAYEEGPSQDAKSPHTARLVAHRPA